VLTDFIEYNDFLEVCDAAIADLGLEGELQVAGFHPHYQFAGTAVRRTSRTTPTARPIRCCICCARPASSAPLRRPDTEEIYRRNIRTLRELGREGWRKLGGTISPRDLAILRSCAWDEFDALAAPTS
jgi:hypothetical protein